MSALTSAPESPEGASAHLDGMDPDDTAATGQSAPRRWNVFAGRREGPEGPEFCDFYPDEQMVRMYGHREVHEVTLVEDRDGDLLGWLDADQARNPGIEMVQHHKVFEVQFAYGSRAEVEEGRGEVVRLRAEARTTRHEPMMWFDNLFGWGAQGPEPKRDNDDPHPVILTVHPRETVRDNDGKFQTYEAEYELAYEHPSTCSGAVEECPIADIVEVQGTIHDELLPGFGVPEPDFLTDEALAAMNGTVRFVVTTRHYSSWSNAEGTEWDVEYTHEWTDNPPTEKNGRLL